MPLYFSFIIFKQKWRNDYTTDVVTRKTYVTDRKTSSAGFHSDRSRDGNIKRQMLLSRSFIQRHLQYFPLNLFVLIKKIGCRLRIPRHMKVCILTCRSISEAAFQEENQYPYYFTLKSGRIIQYTTFVTCTTSF